MNLWWLNVFIWSILVIARLIKFFINWLICFVCQELFDFILKLLFALLLGFMVLNRLFYRVFDHFVNYHLANHVSFRGFRATSRSLRFFFGFARVRLFMAIIRLWLIFNWLFCWPRNFLWHEILYCLMALPNILIKFLNLFQNEVLANGVLCILKCFDEQLALLLFFKEFFSVGYLKAIHFVTTYDLFVSLLSWLLATECWTLIGLGFAFSIKIIKYLCIPVCYSIN